MKREMLEQQHAMRATAAAKDVAEVLETKDAATGREETEILEQRTAVTAPIDCNDQELLALIERQNILTEKTRPK